MSPFRIEHALQFFPAVLLGCVLSIPLAAGQTPAEHRVPNSDLLFSSNRSGDMEIYLLEAGSNEPVNLSNSPGTDNWPVWSPDGRRIAFQSRRNGAFDIYVMHADGSSAVRLTDHEDHDYLPSWTADGQQITFASWRQEEGDSERQNHFYIMNADGSGQRRLLADSPGTSAALEWSPDGTRMVTSWRRGDSTDLRLLDADGNHLAWLTGPDAASDGSPAFSPDGLRVAFYSEGEAASRIEVVTVSTGERVAVLREGRHYYPRWSADGCWLLWSSIVDGGAGEDIDVQAGPLRDAGGDVETIRIDALLQGPGRDAEASWRPRPAATGVVCHE